MPLAPGEKARQRHLLGLQPGSLPPRGRGRGAAACLRGQTWEPGDVWWGGGFGEAGSRSQGGGVSLQSLVQNFVGHGSCHLTWKFRIWNGAVLERGTRDRRPDLARIIFGVGFRPVRVCSLVQAVLSPHPHLILSRRESSSCRLPNLPDLSKGSDPPRWGTRSLN